MSLLLGIEIQKQGFMAFQVTHLRKAVTQLVKLFSMESWKAEEKNIFCYTVDFTI